MTSTTNYSWVLPDVGGSSSTWGGLLNAIFNQQDTDLKAVADNVTLRAHKPGELVMGFWAAAPAGLVEAKGTTIGDASSNATERANADTADLFAVLWAFNNTICPIYDSAGSATTRGVDAATDFAAHKALTVPDLRDRVPRAYKSSGLGPAVATTQEDAMQRITGTVGYVLPTTGGGSTYTTAGAFALSGASGGLYSSAGETAKEVTFNSANSTSPAAAKTNDSETRVKSFGVLACLAL
jgi:hypothetical protein